MIEQSRKILSSVVKNQNGASQFLNQTILQKNHTPNTGLNCETKTYEKGNSKKDYYKTILAHENNRHSHIILDREREREER